MPKIGRRSEVGRVFDVLPLAMPATPRLNQNAPFGNTFSPQWSMKIVAGKPVYAQENGQPISGSPNRSPRHTTTLESLSEKPNLIDPHQIKRLAHAQVERDNQLHASQLRNDKRENFSPYRIVPPINTTRTPSPQFNRQQPFSNNINQSYNRLTLSNRNTDQQQPTSISYDFQSNHNPPIREPSPIHQAKQYEDYNKNLSPAAPYNPIVGPVDAKDVLVQKYLPKDVYLPRQAITMNKDDMWKLLELTKHDVRNMDGNHLKDIYVELTGYDKQLSGWCMLQDVSFILSKNRVSLAADLLRLIASLFISVDQPGCVNYEKVLSFLGTALQHTEGVDNKNGLIQNSSSRSYFDNQERAHYFVAKDTQEPPPPTDSETAKLLHLAEEHFDRSNYVINYDKLNQDFRLADRNHRETLSARQIMEVCYKNRLPLTESVISLILRKCDMRGDGQYHWQKFVDFLERVQPTRTGLPIPNSKQPLDYARTYLSPSRNWPYAEDGMRAQLWKKEPESSPRLIDTMMEQANVNRNVSPRLDNDYRLPPYQEKQQIDDMERQLQDLENNYERMKQRLNDDGDETLPWFERFMKMANAIYAQDIDNSGTSSYDDVKKTVALYNSAYSLNLSEQTRERAILENEENGRVAIHPLLTKLCSQEGR